MYKKDKDASLRIMNQNVWGGNANGRDLTYPDYLHKYDADVICLQEMGPYISTKALMDGLNKYYDFVPVDTNGNMNFTPILCKKGEFDVIECGWHLFTELNDSNSKSVSWALLKKKATGETFGVTSCHFWWQERGIVDDSVRMQNAREMSSFINYMITKYDVPVICLGDLNCNMTSKPYLEILKTGGIDAISCATKYANRDNTWHDYPVFVEGKGFTKGNLVQGTCVDSIDHIFIYNLSKINVYVYNIIEDDDAYIHSDHFPVYVDVKLK